MEQGWRQKRKGKSEAGRDFTQRPSLGREQATDDTNTNVATNGNDSRLLINNKGEISVP